MKMTHTAYIMLAALLLLVGCSARRASVSVETTRHADSVAALRSAGCRSLDRDEVWETVVMLRDTLGNLVPVSREIRRHTEKAKESVQRADTAVFVASTEETYQQEEESIAEAPKSSRRGWSGFKWGVGVSVFVLVAAAVVFILFKKGVLKWN